VVIQLMWYGQEDKESRKEEEGGMEGEREGGR
jgi:hypothetical protein